MGQHRPTARQVTRFEHEPPLFRTAPLEHLATFVRTNLAEIEKRFSDEHREATAVFLRDLEADRGRRAIEYWDRLAGPNPGKLSANSNESARVWYSLSVIQSRCQMSDQTERLVCERCAADAVIHLTKFTDGHPTLHHYCVECARALGASVTVVTTPSDKPAPKVD
jgi:hypothetical protein